MTDSQFTEVPGTDVSDTAPGLIPENTNPFPGGDPLSEIHQHLHDLNQKVDHLLKSRVELLAKVDHLLEHAHQPLEGHITLHPPAKVPAGNDDEWDGDPNCEDCIPDPDLI